SCLTTLVKCDSAYQHHKLKLLFKEESIRFYGFEPSFSENMRNVYMLSIVT
ncbi:hypothetical protein L9F63_009788, partial [Diploptera punctata]